MNDISQPHVVLATQWPPPPNELREHIRAGLSRAVDLARELADCHSTELLAAQMTGVSRAVQQLGATLAAEESPHAHT
jgi:hypothetical protein